MGKLGSKQGAAVKRPPHLRKGLHINPSAMILLEKSWGQCLIPARTHHMAEFANRVVA